VACQAQQCLRRHRLASCTSETAAGCVAASLLHTAGSSAGGSGLAGVDSIGARHRLCVRNQLVALQQGRRMWTLTQHYHPTTIRVRQHDLCGEQEVGRRTS
jgi:hypothetical protein